MLVSVVGSHLVEENGGEADAKLGGDDGEASLGPPVLPARKKKTFTTAVLTCHSAKYGLRQLDFYSCISKMLLKNFSQIISWTICCRTQKLEELRLKISRPSTVFTCCAENSV